MANKYLKEYRVNRDWCKGCSICIELCPKDVLELDDREKSVALRPENCICCMMCELRCPDLAIELIVVQEEKNE